MKTGTFPRVVAALVLTYSGTTTVTANPKTDFSGQGSSEDPRMESLNDFPGAIDGGWRGSWKIIEEDAKEVTVAVGIAEESPLSAEGGNRLQISYERLKGTSGSRAGVVRQFSNNPDFDGIDLLKPYKVKFQFRLDEASGSFNGRSDLLTFAGSTAVSNKGFGKDDQWAIIYKGQRSSSGASGDWAAWSRGKLVPFGAAGSMVDLQTVFDVVVSVDPEANAWDVQVTGGGGDFRASDANGGQPLALGSPGTKDGATFLSFRSSRAMGSTMTWSLDNVEVVQDE